MARSIQSNAETFATAENPPWGLFDKKDRCWLGDENGPLVYDGVKVPFDLARIAEIVFNTRFGYRTRIELRHYDVDARTFVDEVTPRRSAQEALELLGVES